MTKKKKTQSITNSMRIRVTNSYSDNATRFIDLIKDQTPHSSKDYKKAVEEAQSNLSLLDIIAASNKKTHSPTLDGKE